MACAFRYNEPGFSYNHRGITYNQCEVSQATGGRTRKKQHAPARPRDNRWAVWTELGYRYFDTAEEAYAFLFPEDEQERESPKQTKNTLRARVLGPAPEPRVTYAGEDIATVTVKGMPGDAAFGLGDRILAKALQKRIEQEITRRERKRQQEEEIRLAEATFIAERRRQDEDAIALLLLAA